MHLNSADRRHVDGNVGVVVIHARVGQVVAAALGEPAEMPVALDELHERGVLVVDEPGQQARSSIADAHLVERRNSESGIAVAESGMRVS
jgi:hypothetical protein